TAQKVIPRYRSAVPVASFPTEKKPRLSSRKPKTAASKPEGRSLSSRKPKTASSKSEGRSLSRTSCPHCQQKMAKIPKLTLKKKYFLGCQCGAVMFWSDSRREWEQPKPRL
ncbi:hypothetical protein ACQ4M4_25625, partial [Leptolyngbya sp. AN02str]|uniref:hypothetical protein n=1 Tax=Leptolyngbya sp. AN02str TaxID=3423363 RepID=UPI003D31FF8B